MSRRRQGLIIALCLLMGAGLIWLDHSFAERKRNSQPQSAEQIGVRDFEKYHAKTFSVINVVDGDTIDIDVPDGNYPRTRIRLWGIDTPETKHPRTGVMYFGPQASQFCKKLTLQKPVRVYLDNSRTRGYYGRLLAYVQLPDGRFLNEVLLAEGFAYADLRFRHGLYHKYKQLDAAARSANKGLWENVKREQLPEWLQKKKPSLLKK